MSLVFQPLSIHTQQVEASKEDPSHNMETPRAEILAAPPPAEDFSYKQQDFHPVVQINDQHDTFYFNISSLYNYNQDQNLKYYFFLSGQQKKNS